jgi:succinoglycan biosynthesis transport protein ExoP
MSENESAGEFGTYSALLRRRRVWIFTIVPAVLLLAVFAAYAWPVKYRSTATVMFVGGSIPEQFIHATVNSSADEEIETIQGRVMTLDNMKQLVSKDDPYPDETTWSVDEKAQHMILDTDMERVDPVTFEILQKSPAFSLHYENPDPRRAARITQELSDLFLTYHQRERVEAAKAAAKMVEDRAASLAQELHQVDEEYANLRAQHGGTLPSTDDTRGDDARYRAERDLNDLEKQLRAAEEEESLYTIQLSSTSPNLLATQGLSSTSTAMQNNPALASTPGLSDLATVKALLADAELRYTPDHPDVKRLKRALAALQAQQAQAGSSAGADADNPEYRRISSELVAARAEVKALQADTARAREQLQQYTSNSNPSAALTRQVADIERRRTSLQVEFQDVQDKLKNAQLGQVVEADPHAEHFTMLRSPVIAKTPYSPNRIGVILLGFVLACGLAAAAVSAAESSDATVRGVRDLVGYASIPVLGTVSEILIPSDLRRRRMVWGSVTVLYILVTGLVVVTVIQAEIRDHLIQLNSSSERESS